jgi:hypothetical protein
LNIFLSIRVGDYEYDMNVVSEIFFDGNFWGGQNRVARTRGFQERTEIFRISNFRKTF